MFYYKLKIKYNGAGFSGFQSQKGSEQRTIQDEILKSLEKISKSKNVKSLGSGRTDTGVHALGQVVKISCPLDIEAESLIKALNSNLPKEIRVLKSSRSDEDFTPTRDALSKTYEYYFYRGQIEDPFLKDIATFYPYELDFSKVKEALELFVGEYDFLNYFCVGTPVKSTTRKIYETSFEEVEMGFPDQQVLYKITIKGSGFLKQMVRLIVGAIWAYGNGRCDIKDLTRSLEVKLNQKIGATAPPNGLYLKHVEYPDNF